MMTFTQDYPSISIGRQGDPEPVQADKPAGSEEETYYMPIYIITAVFGAIFIFGPLVVRKGPHRPITRCCIMLAAVCIWLFWVTIYISQMNPLLGPRVHNTTLAWVGYRWGKNAKEYGALSED